MKKMIKFASVAVAVLALTQTIQAIPFVAGSGIQIVGSAVLDGTSAGNATEVVSWNNTTVQNATGSFLTPGTITPIPGAVVTFSSSIWKFDGTTLPINNFWAVGGFTFNLLTSAITSQGAGAVAVNGSGTVQGNGFGPQTLYWSFTSRDPGFGVPASYSFSASTVTQVPDGGSTIMLLGLALSGAALLRKKLTA